MSWTKREKSSQQQKEKQRRKGRLIADMRRKERQLKKRISVSEEENVEKASALINRLFGPLH